MTIHKQIVIIWCSNKFQTYFNCETIQVEK